MQLPFCVIILILALLENDDIKKAADPSMASDFTSADISVAGIQQQAITGTTFSCSVEKNSREQQQSVTDKVSLEKPFAEPKSIVPSMYTGKYIFVVALAGKLYNFKHFGRYN